MARKSEHVGNLSGEVSSEILGFMKEHPSLEYDHGSKKIRCNLAGHELPCQLPALMSYVNGKKYKQWRSHGDFGYEKYEPHIIQSKRGKNRGYMLFCKLTSRELSKTPTDVERHVNGRRYQKALKKFEECQRLGIKFVPPSRQKRQSEFGKEAEGEAKKFSTNPEDSGDESDNDDAESVDSMSDLYPAGDFEVDEEEVKEEEKKEQGDGEEDAAADVENMEVDDTRPVKEARKHTEQEDGDVPNKKFKKGKSNERKGKQQQKQQQKQNGKGDESASGSNTSKGKKKKKPRIM